MPPEADSETSVARRRWFDRRFQLGIPVEAMPDIIERVRGTPARLEERLQGVSPSALVRRIDNSWSIQENAGHLLDLEELWEVRLDELLAGAHTLHAADLQNRRTDEANHNARALSDILREFRGTRLRVVQRLEQLTEPQLRSQALHPRLQQPMTIVDLFFFVAEHDDHHLARITELIARVEFLKV
jgi:uncharacterized damage-inducible protein DinB